MKLCSNSEQFNSSCASRYYCLHLLLIWFIYLCFTKRQMVIQYQLQSYQIDMLNVTMYIFKTLIKTLQINHLLKCCSYARMLEIKKIDISIFHCVYVRSYGYFAFLVKTSKNSILSTKISYLVFSVSGKESEKIFIRLDSSW